MPASPEPSMPIHLVSLDPSLSYLVLAGGRLHMFTEVLHFEGDTSVVHTASFEFEPQVQAAIEKLFGARTQMDLEEFAVTFDTSQWE